MTYNPRIKNRRNNKLQVTGSILTGSVADFGVVTGSVVTGAYGYFSNLTVDTINITTTIDTTASYANNAGLLDGLDSTAFVQTGSLANLAVTSLAAGNGLTGTDTTGSITLNVGAGTGIVVNANDVAIDAGVVVTITGSQTISGEKTFSAKLSGTTAEFVSITGSFSGSGSGLTNIPNGALQNSSITINGTPVSLGGSVSTGDITEVIAGVGLNGGGASGSVTLDVDVAEVVTITGSQTISGQKSFSANLSGTTAEFTSITGTLNGNITGNAATVTNGVYTNTIGNVATTAVTAGSGLTGGGTTGSLTLNVGAGTGIVVNSDDVAIDTTAVVTITGSQTISGIKQFSSPLTGTYAYFSQDVVINGTASIGFLNTLGQQSLVVGDKYITILSGATDHTTLDGSGFLWGSGSTGPTVDELGANAHIRYRNSFDALEVFPGLIVSGSTTLAAVSGTTAQLTTVTASLGNVGTLVVTTATATNLTAASLSTNVTGVTANFNLGSLTGKHIILGDATAAEITGTLPLAAAAPYKQFIFKKTDATENALAISASGGETIDGDNKVEIVTQYETLTIVSDGVNKWLIV